MSKRARRLKPSETARQDQYESMARDMGRQDRTAVFTTSYAPPNLQCEWCDCPEDDPRHQDPDYRCAGCGEQSYYLLRLFHGRPEEAHLLLCAGHYGDAVKRLNGMVRDRIKPLATSVLAVDILDRGGES